MTRSPAIAVLMAATVFAAAAASVIPHQNGRFALLGGTPQIVSKFWATHGTGSSYTLNVQQFAKSGAAIKVYEIDMQHYMHVVVIRDDFATFAHEHPTFDAATGIFQAPFTKEKHHRYYVYADSLPNGIGQQVFRFVVDSDGLEAGVRVPTAATGPNTTAGPYTVTLAKTTLHANTPLAMPLTVKSANHPAGDLVPYLGAPAHVVLIDVNRLTYVHVHPILRGQKAPKMSGSMSSMHGMSGSNMAGAFMQLELPALPPSTYATWVQIAGGKAHTVYTARFNLVVQ